jgi:hypothetical protein
MALLPLMHRHLCIVTIRIVAFMTMALLPLSMRRCLCHCQDGVVSLVTIASLPLIHNSVVALVVIASLPSLSWRCCPCCNGVAIIINVIALVARRQAGITADNAQASLPLLL